MAEYVLALDFYGFSQIQRDLFAWPRGSAEAEVIAAMERGDTLVPKFAQTPVTGIDQAALAQREAGQRAYCGALGLEYDKVRNAYEMTVHGGEGAVPYILTVTGHLPDETVLGEDWTRVSVDREKLAFPLSTHEFLRLRALPSELARQLKGMTAPGRHVQELPSGAAAAIREAGSTKDRAAFLRRYSVVVADSVEDAVDELGRAGRAPVTGDWFFVASADSMLGAFEVDPDGMRSVGGEIRWAPTELRSLFEQAKSQAVSSGKSFAAGPALKAAEHLSLVILNDSPVSEVESASHFHDRFVLLKRKVTQALALRPLRVVEGDTSIGTGVDAPEGPEPTIEDDELAQLEGLSVEALREQLPGFEITRAALAEVATALRSGKHLLLSGPPGTGKSTLAEAICRAVVDQQYDVATATADWTTFDTIGGYMPSDEGLRFEPGIVLRALQSGRWLVIDELNRADIDKAFGPLFTLLAGTGNEHATRGIVLPYQEDGHPITIRAAEHRGDGADRFVLTPTWRLIGTLNVSDKASLFQLSFAFLRRFAVIDVPLPPRAEYEEWFRRRCADVPDETKGDIVTAAMNLAHATPTRQLGPAILADIARFIDTGLVVTADGSASYEDAVEAFLTAARLYAIPQYEGATASETAAAAAAITEVWPAEVLPAAAWTAFQEALRGVAVA